MGEQPALSERIADAMAAVFADVYASALINHPHETSLKAATDAANVFLDCVRRNLGEH